MDGLPRYLKLSKLMEENTEPLNRPIPMSKLRTLSKNFPQSSFKPA